MTPERLAGVVTQWVRFYTRNLPDPVAQRRADEVTADLHDHTAHERAQGTSERRIALSILSRMIRGTTADASWRRQARRQGGSVMKPVVVVILAILAVALGVAAVVYGESDDSPGLQLIGFALVAGAVTLSVRRARRSR